MLKVTADLGSRGALAILLVVLVACADDAPDLPSEPAVRPAKLVTIAEDEIVRTSNFPAVISAQASANLAFEVGGLIEELPVEEGIRVEEGALIARLDQRPFQNDVATARAQFDNAQAEFERAERLIAQDAIARSVFEQRRAARDVARASLDNARKRLEDSVITAPFDGIIARRHTEQFQNVAPGAPVVTLETTGAAEAVVQVPSTLVARSGQLEPIETLVFLDVAPNTPVPATLFSFSTQTQASAQTFEARFSFEPPEGLNILPGMTGNVRLKLARREGDMAARQVIVPLAAVVAEAGDPYVFVVDPGTYEISRRPVTVRPSEDGRLAVIDGLVAGETIVAAGAAFLQDGMTVRPYEG